MRLAIQILDTNPRHKSFSWKAAQSWRAGPRRARATHEDSNIIRTRGDQPAMPGRRPDIQNEARGDTNSRYKHESTDFTDLGILVVLLVTFGNKAYSSLS